MAGLLEGQIAKAIYDGFKGKLLKGTLTRAAPDRATGLDELGDPNSTVASSWPCQGFADNYSEFFRATAGIPDTDLSVSIFAASLPAGVKPQKDDRATLKDRGVSTTYQLRSASTDPATALWVCRAFKVQPATEDCRT